jgi:hypothetical protein
MKHLLISCLLLGLVISGCSSTKPTTDSSEDSDSKYKNITTALKTANGLIIIPGMWNEFTYEADSKQHFLKNADGIIIAVAVNKKKTYSFYKSSKSNFESVNDFFKWEYDYRVGEGFESNKILENEVENYIIWKFAEKTLDNVFLYGVKSDLFVNYLVYTDKWDEQKKIDFLIKLYNRNKE